jgi:glycosyltransferase involved in cell wall biosynthesis
MLFLGYWDINDPLTKATIYPHLEVLQSLSTIEYILFVNTQRRRLTSTFAPGFRTDKIRYNPIFSKSLGLNILTKIYDFIHFPAEIRQLVRDHSIDLIIARGAPAGSLAYLVWKMTSTPFMVESFEPHADYMLATGTWSRLDPRYWFQKYWENRQLRVAQIIATVSNNYRGFLINRGLSGDKIKVMPCSVNTSVFFPSRSGRAALRKELSIPEEGIVGIYAGKFGGLYMEEDAFKLFKGAFDYFEDRFYLLLLSSINKSRLNNACRRAGIPVDRLRIRWVDHSEMNNFLNVGEFGFAPYKQTAVSPFLSPVKIGEYWACGLPVLLTDGVGDESNFLELEKGGVKVDPKDIGRNDLKRVFERMHKLFSEKETPERCVKLATRFRASNIPYQVYDDFLKNVHA